MQYLMNIKPKEYFDYIKEQFESNAISYEYQTLLL